MATKRQYADAADELARRDRALARAIRAVGPPDIRRGRPPRAHFAELCRAVCYQQLAGAAASTIHGRFEACVGDVTPERVLATPVAQLRACGLSGSKTASIRDLAAKVREGTVELERFGRMADDRVVAELTTVRGIGRWTAEMFLMFQLRRIDVWPTGDLGVRKGYARIYGLDPAPTPKVLEDLGEPHRPYRSVLAWYCWRVMDTQLPTAAGTSPRRRRTRR